MEKNNLSPVERAMLANQNRILAKLIPEDQERFLENAGIFENGYEIEYSDALGVSKSTVSADISHEVVEILQMFLVIHNNTKALKAEERSQLDPARLRFEGFDGNNDLSHSRYTDFLAKKGDFEAVLGGHAPNSHNSMSLGRYRKMLPVYKRLLEKSNNSLTLSDLKELSEIL